MWVVLDGLGSAALLWGSGRGGGNSPCCGIPEQDLAQGKNSKIKLRHSGLMPG